jgi:hypothetical protein
MLFTTLSFFDGTCFQLLLRERFCSLLSNFLIVFRHLHVSATRWRTARKTATLRDIPEITDTVGVTPIHNRAPGSSTMASTTGGTHWRTMYVSKVAIIKQRMRTEHRFEQWVRPSHQRSGKDCSCVLSSV